MTMWLKQSTAATVKMGPFLDDTDGKTAETALTISQADIRLAKNGATLAQSNNSAGATHDALGYYDVPLDTTDTNTLGRLKVAVSESGALPVWQEFMVVPANVWDSLFGADKLQVHADEITAGLITAASIASDAITDAKVASDVTIASVTGAVGSVTGNVGGSVASVTAGVTLATGAITAAVIATDAIDADAIAASAVTEIQSGLATQASVDTIDDFLDTEIAAIKAKTDNLPASPASEATLTTIAGYLDTEIAAIKAKTDNLPTDPADESSIQAAITAVSAFIDTEIATLITNVAAILADTGTDGVALSTAVKQAIADEVLKRGVSNVEDAASGASLAELILLAMESSASGATLTIRKTTGATFSTRTLTLDAGAEPIVGIT